MAIETYCDQTINASLTIGSSESYGKLRFDTSGFDVGEIEVGSYQAMYVDAQDGLFELMSGTSDQNHAITGRMGGEVELNYEGSTKLETVTYGILISGELNISTINNVSTDTDKFLVSDSGTVKYRTGAQVLSDIGGAPATGGAYLPLAGGTLTGGLIGTTAKFDAINLEDESKITFDDDGDQWNWIRSSSGQMEMAVGQTLKLINVEESLYGDIEIEGLWSIVSPTTTTATYVSIYTQSASNTVPIRQRQQTLAQFLSNAGGPFLPIAGGTITGNLEVTDGSGGEKVLTLTANTGSFKIGDIDGLGDRAHIEGDSSSIKIFTGGAGGETLVCDSNQNVGIGTTSLTSISSVVATLSLGSTSTSVSGAIAFQANDIVKAYNYVSNGYLYNQTVAGIGQIFLEGSSERMRIHGTTGNVGIGTNNPNYELDVAGDIYSSGQMLTKGQYMASFTVLGDLDTGLGNWDGSGQVGLVSNNKAVITAKDDNIAFDAYDATAVATTGSLNPNQSQQAVTEDTLAILAVDPDGNVVRGSQEGTWTFTKAQIDALTTSTTSGTTLIAAPGANKAVIVEESNLMIKYSGTGTMSSNSFVIRQAHNGDAAAEITRLPSGQINTIMSSAPANPSYGFYSRDLPLYNNDGRSFVTNKATFLSRISTNATPTNLVSISIKLKYRLFDVDTF